MFAAYLFSFCALCNGVVGLRVQNHNEPVTSPTLPRVDVDAKPMTEERAAEESPRTAWSINHPNQMTKWSALHEKLAAEASMYKSSEPGHHKLALIGDSITESWRGTTYDFPTNRAFGVPDVFSETLALRWQQPLVLAIAGDQTQHVLWRLSHGELSPAMAADPGLMFNVLIGTNNFGHGKRDRHSANETYEGIMAVTRSLLHKTKGKVLLNALLPRGDGEPKLRNTKQNLCPGPRCDLKGQPFHSFMERINFVNNKLAASVETLSKKFPGRVDFVDCGEPFRTNAEDPVQAEEVTKELMPDRLHPNAKGHQLMANCLQVALEKLEAQ